MRDGFTVVISHYGIEVLQPGDSSLRSLDYHRRAAKVLHGHPPPLPSFSRDAFRLHVALLRVGREIERELRHVRYRLRRLTG